MHTQPTAGWIAYLVTAAIICLVLFLRVRGMRRARPLRLEQLWIVPAIYALLTGWILYQFPPHGAKSLWLVAALGVGLAAGWRRGAHMRITIDPQTHALNQQASPAAIVFLVVLILLRQGLRYEAPRLGLDIMLVTDILMVLALGLFTATRAEMYVRARRLLAVARTG